MKEIDFLPEWYKSGRRRQSGYRTQCVALAGMFAVMMAWNFISLNSISKARAELARMAAEQPKAQTPSKEFIKVKNQVIELQKKARILKDIDPKIDVASVLAEMSFLIGEKIVLSKVEFISEKFLNKRQPEANTSSVVRIAGAKLEKERELPLGDVRFKVVINGIAADASDVADLICKLEDSPYFSQVYPSFSRNKTIQTIGKIENQKSEIGNLAEGGLQVSEFEISCYLANYCQDKY